MIPNVENVVEWLRENNLEHWTVSTANTDNKKVFETMEDENLEARFARFRKVMTLTTGGRFIIVAKKNKTDSRGLFSDDFVNNPGIAGLQKENTPPVISGLTEDQVEKKIEAARQNWERDAELKELREQKKQLEMDLKEKDTAMNRIFMKLEPHIGTLAGAFINKIMPQGATVAMGTTTENIFKQNNPTEDMPNEQNEPIETRVENAVEKWATADPENFVRIIEFIADFASSDKTISPFPGVNLGYKQITEMLK